MTDHTPNVSPDMENQEPFIPPKYMLILSLVGFLVAIVVALTQPEFGVIGYGGLAFGVLALLAWVLMAPDQAKAALTGRTARFGGVSVLVTLVFIGALIAVYVGVRSLKARVDLTEREDYSLAQESRDAMQGLGEDPNLPHVRLLVFIGAQQAGQRDQYTLLFDDYVKTSGGKIDYQFLDIDRDRQLASLYGVAGPGQVAVVPLDPQGQPIVESKELVSSLALNETSSFQQELTNTILKVSAQGDFRAYIMDVQDGVSTTEAADANTPSMSILVQALSDRFNWTVQNVNFVDLSRPDSEIKLNDPAADGEVLIIAGGSKPLSDQEMTLLTDYVTAGGDLVIFAGDNFNTEFESLATGQNLSDFLWNTFGMRFRNDVVLDSVQAIQSPAIPFVSDLDPENFITTNNLPPGQTRLILQVPHSIEIADTLPTNVSVSELARTSETSYAKNDYNAVLNNELDKSDADTPGPLIVGASAENAQTGARVVLWGSVAPLEDAIAQLQQPNIANTDVAFNSFVWTTHFNDFVQNIVFVPQQQRPQDAPIFADAQTLRNINFITMILVPFGILGLGFLVWWNNRERSRASR
jgi:hypothetical protein